MMTAKFKTCFAYQTTSVKCNIIPHYAKTELKNNRYQWLTDGYYFWINSNIYAKWWGETVLKEEYTITKYELCIEREKVLDLLENPDDEEWFLYIISLYLEKYEAYKKYDKIKKVTVPTVCTVIDFMKNKFKDSFPLAIFITDDFCNKKFDSRLGKNKWLRMTPNSKKSHEIYKTMGRPQVCVFEEAYQYIKPVNELC